MDDIAERRLPKQVGIAGHPIYSMLLPVAIVSFAGALAADIAYAMTETLMWLNFTNWLIPAGLLFGFVAAIFLLIDFVRVSTIRTGAGWAHLLLFGAAWIVELVNMFVHNRDGWTAVVPLGMILSIVAVGLILAAGWLWRPIETEIAR